jgi:hypothetical protein
MNEKSVERPCRPKAPDSRPRKEPVRPEREPGNAPEGEPGNVPEAEPVWPEAERREGVVSNPDF